MRYSRRRKYQVAAYTMAALLAVITTAVAVSGCTGRTDLPAPPLRAVRQEPLNSSSTKVPPPAPVVAADDDEPNPWETQLPRIDGARIVIDPGHGGHDPGTLGGGYARVPEKEVVLGIARELATRLEALGARVTLTRQGDEFLSLDARAELAERTAADLFVSIHADAAADSDASGATVYIARQASHASTQAAARLDQTLRRWNFKSRGVRRAGFRVLVGHSRPAVLVECGYMTNATDAQRLSATWYQKRVARTLTEAIARYFHEDRGLQQE